MKPYFQLLSTRSIVRGYVPRFRYRDPTAAVMWQRPWVAIAAKLLRPNKWRRKLRNVAVCILSAISASACATLEPSSISADVEHMSHASQHIGPDQSDYGLDVALVSAHWQPLPRLEITLAEGASIGHCRVYEFESAPHHMSECGAFAGPREVFEGKASFTLWARQ